MDDLGVTNDLTTLTEAYLNVLDDMILDGDQWALKMGGILYVGRAGFCRAAAQGDEALRTTAKGFPGFTYIELRELANKIRVRHAIARLL